MKNKTISLQALTDNVDMLLFNEFYNASDEVELVAWSDMLKYSDLMSKEDFRCEKANGNIDDHYLYDDHSEEIKETYQTFIINESDGVYIAEKTWLPLYFSEKLQLHAIGIDCFGTSWSSVYYKELN